MGSKQRLRLLYKCLLSDGCSILSYNSLLLKVLNNLYVYTTAFMVTQCVATEKRKICPMVQVLYQFKIRDSDQPKNEN